MNGFLNSTMYYLFSILAVVAIIFLAYFSTVFIARKSNNLLKNKHAKVIDRTNLGLNLSILAIQVNNKVYILLQHYKQMELLDVVEEEEWFSNKKAYIDKGADSNRLEVKTLFKANRIKSLLKKNSYIKGEDNKYDKD